MRDKLYEEFHDPSQDFLREPRAFCYELASNLIDQAKEAEKDKWHENIAVIKSIFLLLYTWNFAAKETKKLNFENVGKLIKDAKDDLKFLERYSIENADDDAWKRVKLIFDKFRSLLGQTGASKALSLLNPGLFVMWDTAIRKRLNKDLIPGIMNGERGEYYVKFLKGIQKIIEDHRIIEKLPHGSVVAKKIDEYHYVKIVMNKAVKFPKHSDDEGGYTTYKNIANPHVTIHCDGCKQIKKRGGHHQYGQGSYENHETYADAKAYAESTGLPILDCSYCKPRRQPEPKKARRSMSMLPYSNNSFNPDDLKEYIRRTGRNFIIQGQVACRRADHPKPSSLDCWLRDNYAKNPDTKQAVNEVIAALVNTGEFTEGDFICPDSGRRCKGVRIAEV
jgi:hypothetical protein